MATQVHEISTVELESRPALLIKKAAKTMQMGKVMGTAFGRVLSRIESQGAARRSEDMPFCIYRDLDWDALSDKGIIATFKMMFFKEWHLELGITTPSSLEGIDDIETADLPAGRFVRTIHQGPYTKVGDTYKRIRQYAQETGLDFENYSIERYINDPGDHPPEDLETEVLVPIASGK